MRTASRRDTAVFTLGVVAAAGWIGCDRAGSPFADRMVAPIDSVQLDLGNVRPGVQASGMLRLANSTDRAWHVARVGSSCPCVVVHPASFEVGAGEATEIAATFDPTSEPDFRGRLLVDVRGETADGSVVCTAQVTIMVEN